MRNLNTFSGFVNESEENPGKYERKYQEYLNRPVVHEVSFPAGGTFDAIGKAEDFLKDLGYAKGSMSGGEPIGFAHMLSRLVGLKVGALAAIGNPKKFFDALTKLGVHIDQTLALPDHAPVQPNDLKALAVDLILITEKDAVKCAGIEDSRIWVVPMRLEIPPVFSDWMQEVITRPNPYLK